MTEEKKKKLEAEGFQVGTVAEFLDLTVEEQAMIENVIIKNGKPIGVCDCLGKGKQNCKGNGWIKDGSGYQKCPFFAEFK
jgi:hypothetical protein